MSVVVIDWLGRGGIAQTAEAWATELGAAGRRVTVVTRGGLELGSSGAVNVAGSPVGGGPIATHVRLIRKAASLIRAERPAVVIVQNYLIPLLERSVYRAVRDAGSMLIVVVHDHRLHSMLAGTRLGLGAALRQADHVVVHSRYVAEGVRTFAQVTPVVVPLPVITGTMAHATEAAPRALAGDGLLALHFGVLKRRYKGVDVIVELAAERPEGWRIALVGNGAPAHVDGAVTISGFVPPATLVACIRASDATLLPYRYATQSGAVALAQVLGSVPVVPDVGGLSEQVDDGRTGLVVPRGAAMPAWAAALHRLRDPGERRQMAAAGREQRLADHRRFRAAILELTGTTTSNVVCVDGDDRIARLVRGADRV